MSHFNLFKGTLRNTWLQRICDLRVKNETKTKIPVFRNYASTFISLDMFLLKFICRALCNKDRRTTKITHGV